MVAFAIVPLLKRSESLNQSLAAPFGAVIAYTADQDDMAWVFPEFEASNNHRIVPFASQRVSLRTKTMKKDGRLAKSSSRSGGDEAVHRKCSGAG